MLKYFDKCVNNGMSNSEIWENEISYNSVYV